LLFLAASTYPSYATLPTVVGHVLNRIVGPHARVRLQCCPTVQPQPTQLQLAILLHHQHVTCRISRECLPVTAYGFATCMIFLVSSNIFKLSYLYVTSVAFKQPGCASQLSISSQASQLRILGLQRRGILTSFKTSPVNIDGRRLVF
jgi:hypothetical protein